MAPDALRAPFCRDWRGADAVGRKSCKTVLLKKCKKFSSFESPRAATCLRRPTRRAARLQPSRTASHTHATHISRIIAHMSRRCHVSVLKPSRASHTRHISHESLPTCHVGVTSQFSSLHASHTRHISHESLPTCHVGVTSQFSHECAPRRHRFSKLACTSMLWRGQAHTTNRQSALKSLYGTFGLVMTLTAMTLHHIHKTRANACLQNLYAIRICLAAAEAFWSSLLHMWRRRLVAE
jgi:hypothetical protein